AQDMGQRMEEAQAELASKEVLGTAGGGIVQVTLNGHLHLVGVRIDPSAIDRDDPTMLEDLILAAWSDARDGVARLQAQADPLGGMGGLGGLGGLLGGG
ncbi:MAG: YbaB/EbfC family nucleoid-associated protein, partial [Actinobacteria bacterium]|nr:YbaB/EbfC family nucleoid-associated protein [Actinomycetota bacterium]